MQHFVLYLYLENLQRRFHLRTHEQDVFAMLAAYQAVG